MDAPDGLGSLCYVEGASKRLVENASYEKGMRGFNKDFVPQETHLEIPLLHVVLPVPSYLAKVFSRLDGADGDRCSPKACRQMWPLGGRGCQ